MLDYNQDDVALRLMRVSSEEMHKLMYDYGSTDKLLTMSWERIVRLPGTIEFLLANGYTAKEYAKQCMIDAKFSRANGRGGTHLYMMDCFANLL